MEQRGSPRREAWKWTQTNSSRTQGGLTADIPFGAPVSQDEQDPACSISCPPAPQVPFPGRLCLLSLAWLSCLSLLRGLWGSWAGPRRPTADGQRLSPRGKRGAIRKRGDHDSYSNIGTSSHLVELRGFQTDSTSVIPLEPSSNAVRYVLHPHFAHEREENAYLAQRGLKS